MTKAPTVTSTSNAEAVESKRPEFYPGLDSMEARWQTREDKRVIRQLIACGFDKDEVLAFVVPNNLHGHACTTHITCWR